MVGGKGCLTATERLMNSLFFNIISKYEGSQVSYDYGRQGVVAKLPDEIDEFDWVILKGLEFELDNNGDWFLEGEKFNRISVGLSEDWPDFVNGDVVKKCFMWLHEKGFEGEQKVVVKRNRKKVYFLHIDRPSKWNDEKVEKFTGRLVKAIARLIKK